MLALRSWEDAFCKMWLNLAKCSIEDLLKIKQFLVFHIKFLLFFLKKIEFVYNNSEKG